MNKEKLLYLFNEMGKSIFNRIDGYVLVMSIVLGAFGKQFEWIYVQAVAGFLLYIELIWFGCGLLSWIITELIIRYRKKKSNIQKLIDEEINKNTSLEKAAQNIRDAVNDFVSSCGEEEGGNK